MTTNPNADAVRKGVHHNGLRNEVVAMAVSQTHPKPSLKRWSHRAAKSTEVPSGTPETL